MSYPPQGYGPPPPGYPPPGPGGYGPYPPGPPPRRNNTGVIVGFVGIVVVAILAVVLAVVLTGGGDKETASGTQGTTESGSDSESGSGSDSDSSSGSGSGDGGPSPEAMADEVVRVVEHHETETIRRYACTEQEAADLYGELARLDGVEVSASVTGVRKSGDTAQASIKMTAGGQSEDFTVEMARNDAGLWCVTGI